MEMFSSLPLEFRYTCLTSLLMCRNQKSFFSIVYSSLQYLFSLPALIAVIFPCADVK